MKSFVTGLHYLSNSVETSINFISALTHIIPEVSVHDRAVIRSLQFPGKYLIFTKFSDYDQ